MQRLGKFLGFVLADTFEAARQGAQLVMVSYEDVWKGDIYIHKIGMVGFKWVPVLSLTSSQLRKSRRLFL